MVLLEEVADLMKGSSNDLASITVVRLTYILSSSRMIVSTFFNSIAGRINNLKVASQPRFGDVGVRGDVCDKR